MHLPGPRKRPLRVHVLHVKGSDDRLPSQLVAEREKLSGSSVYWGQHLASSTPPVHDESFYYGVVMSCTPRAPLYLVHLVHTPLPVGCSLRKRRPGAETKGTLPPMPLEIFDLGRVRCQVCADLQSCVTELPAQKGREGVTERISAVALSSTERGSIS